MVGQTLAKPAEARRANHIVFFEIGVPDIVKGQAFYGGLFAWTFTPAGPSFAMIQGAGVDGGLVVDSRPASGRPTTRIFVRVDDLARALNRARELGGSLEVPPTQVGPEKFIAELKDPFGNAVGLLSTKP